MPVKIQDAINYYKNEVRRLGAKKRWEGVSKEDRSRLMKEVRQKGLKKKLSTAIKTPKKNLKI